MGRYKYLLFDLDGTLTDPFEGITKSFQYALRAYNIDAEQNELLKVIGPPLIESFCKYYGFDEKTGWEAVEKYRERFSVTGWQENRVLDGVPQMLEEVKNSGKIMVLATAKPYDFAVKILDKFELAKYFDITVGAQLRGDLRTKSQVIEKALSELGNPNKEEVLMIGDREDDVKGAKNNGIDCVGVRFGYAAEGELENAGADYIVDTVDDLKKFLLAL